MAVGPYKPQNQIQGAFNNAANSKALPITSFPNGRVTTMLQNSYSNSVGPNGGANNYSRSNVNVGNIKNFRIQDQCKCLSK